MKKLKNEFNKIKWTEKTVDRENLVCRINEYTYSFKIFWTKNTCGRDNYNGKITLKEANEDQSSLLVGIVNLKKKTTAKSREKTSERYS